MNVHTISRETKERVGRAHGLNVANREGWLRKAGPGGNKQPFTHTEDMVFKRVNY